MEFLIGLLIFGAVIFLLPYIIGGVLAIVGVFIAVLAGFVALIKSFGRK
jgi:predicted anti-sigma-YlaC factor YlaD